MAQFAASLSGGQSGQQGNPFQGLGPLLEEDDATVFDTVDGLVLRQEILALNHLAMDTHWTYVKMGYPWSTLVKEPGRDVWKQSLDYGSTISIQAVPNKAWDQINKTTEALLVDFPQVDCEPQDDTEEAEAACDIAQRFLTQNAGEQGTNDAQLVWDRLQRSLTCASSYVEVWTDPTGGGYVPLAIPAHPQAQSPMQPLLGPNGDPTDSPVMRYVTSVGPDGQPTPESQFTDDPTQAAPQWEPELRISKWQREHVRVFPETMPVEKAEKVVILGYCTLGEAKRRWPSVAQMPPEDLSRLCDWQPRRYLSLLPFFQRGRWKLTDGRDKNKQGSSDERIMFYYHVYAIASPDHKKGADVVVTGALNKLVIDRKPLSVEIERDVSPEDNPHEQQPGVVGSITPQGPVTRKETRCMEIPVAQLTPRGDPDDQDPSGRAYIELIAGAVESNAHLALSAAEIIDKNLHLEGYSSATSPVLGSQRENARASGDLIPLIRPEDKPIWGNPIPFEQAFFNFYNLSDQAINSMGSTERAAKGQPSDEKSGRAIQLATANNNVSLSGMNNAVNAFYTRLSRLKLERMMADYTTQQKIAYVGDDGIFKEEDFNALDFALVGNISIKAGTGGLVTSDQKIQNLGGLVQMNMLTQGEAQEAARPAFSQKLGLGADPAEQRIERQITAFNKGPPQGLEPDPNAVPNPQMPGAEQQPVPWVARWQSYQRALQSFQQQQQAAQLAAQNAGAQAQHATATQGAPPAPQQPVRTAMLPPKMPWTPFGRLPTDNEPAIATLRTRKLSRLINSAKFESWPVEWQGVAISEYQAMAQVVASVTPLPPLPKGVTVQAKAADAGTAAQEEESLEHPAQAPAPKPPPVMPIPTQPARPPLAATPASHPTMPVHPATAGVIPPVHSPLANLGAH